MPPGFAMQALRVAVVAVPAVLIVLFAGLVAALALVMDRERREYALDFVRACTDLASVLVNGSRNTAPPRRQRPGTQASDSVRGTREAASRGTAIR
jgi:hypothetical protein